MRKILFCLVSLGLILGLVRPVQARDVSLEAARVDVTLLEDGSMQVSETWTIDFDGEFTRFSKNLPLVRSDGARIEMSDVSVSVDGVAYRELPAFDSRRPIGNFANEMSSTESNMEIYLDANDETKIVNISYTLTNAFIAYDDVIDLNHAMIGDGWDYEIERVEGTIAFPATSSTEDIRVWGHGPANGTVQINDNQSVSYSCQHLPENTELSIRLLLPSDLFTMPTTSGNELDAIVAEEENYVLQEEARQDRIRMQWIVGAIVSAVGIAVVIWLMLKVRKLTRPYQTDMAPAYYRDLPSHMPPSELIDLFNYRLDHVKEDNKFASTLLRFCLYGMLEFETYEEDGLFKSKQQTRILFKDVPLVDLDLQDYEKEFYQFLRGYAGHDMTLELGELKKKMNRHPERARSQLESFKEGSKALLEMDGMTDHTISRYTMKYAGAMIAIFALAILGIVFFQAWLLIALVIVSIIGFIYASTRKRLSQKGENEYVLWKAFEHFLNEFTLMDEKDLPELVMWEQYLVYAAALGVADTVLKRLPEVYPDFYESDFYYHSYVRFFYFSNMRMPNLDLFDGISTFSNDLVTAMHYTANHGGHGGGFSSFGGGGSSGGGGGSFD